MDIKPIIVREYLSSLKEDEELDNIFPILLESLGYVILSKPKESKGFPQYGKDIVAIGVDTEDKIKKRFYFELKGGNDRDITDSTLHKKDGIIESLREAKYRKFIFSNKKQEELPLKIVLVHNGEIKANVKETFEGFISDLFPSDGKVEFDRWGISELTKLFSEKLFSIYLLTDNESTKLFNKVLVNLDSSDKVSPSFIELLDNMFSRIKKEQYGKTLSRRWKMLFESLNLISFIIYTESKGYNNLEIAKKYHTLLIVRFWYWIIKNQFENDIPILKYFGKTLSMYFKILIEFFDRTYPIASLKDGLCFDKAGRYEQIGYTIRTFDYLQYFCFYLRINKILFPSTSDDTIKSLLINLLNNNSVSVRPLIDINSIPIIDVLNLLIDFEDIESAKNYLKRVLYRIKHNKVKYDKFPDANNSIPNVIKLHISNEKSIYYSDSTSPLLAVLMEYTAILDMETEYNEIRDFILESKIDLGLFIPHQSNANNEFDIDVLLFSETYYNKGYQSIVSLHKGFSEIMTFQEFKDSAIERKEEFIYEYRTDKAGFHFLRDLAHIYFKTPYFPDRWRKYL